MLGFWLYLMSDCLIFAVLFATYGVLGRSYAAGPSAADLFELPLVALNTALLLFSSITYGFAMLEMENGRQAPTLFWLAVTGLFGAGFRRPRTERIRAPDPRRRRAAAQRLPVVVLHAGGHPRPARHLRHRLAGHADGQVRSAASSPRTSAA